MHLNPGELFVLREPCIITTVLGSCVSVVFHSFRLKVSAINHAVLPRGKDLRDGENQYKFADLSLAYMMNTFTRMGIKKNETVVKLFGGSDLFRFNQGRNGTLKIGRNNIRATLELLEVRGYSVAACDVGGGRGRRIYFNTENGEVIVKRLKSGENPNIPTLKDCRDYLEELRINPGQDNLSVLKGEKKWQAK